MNNLQPFLNVATEAAIAAGEVLMSYLGRCEAQEKGRPGDLVTQADKASEAKILQILRTSLPDHAIMTEESGQFGDRHNPYLWVIDPLDGTTNFAHQYPVFSVSIGFMIHGIPRVGVILDPSQHRLYQAVSGGGQCVINSQSMYPQPLNSNTVCSSPGLPMTDGRPLIIIMPSFAT
jgi:myo-inositol-1(or 4)-monophosphatase